MAENAVELPPTAKKIPSNITVREAIAKLAMSEDMDAEIYYSFHNSDPIAVTDISDIGDGQIVLS